MADAEVKLNFTAEVEQARAAIEEVAAAMERLQDSGGVMRAEDAELLNEMQGQLVAYKARLDELSAAYARLQQGGGQANERALAQIRELEGEVANLTKQQDGLLKKVVDLQVENNKLKGKEEEATEGEKDMTAAQRVMSETGQHAYTTLKGAVGGFIKSLFAGKLAVRELGLALKGLMYSTVVLAAIQLAMEGIMWAWDGIKSLFGQSEEQMEAAEEAAQRAREELERVRGEAAAAAEELQRLKNKIAEKEEAEALAAVLAGITAEYAAQRDAVEGTLAALREQAQVKARERALEAAQRTGELDMELLDLEERFVSGDIRKRDYIVQKADIEKRKRDEARVAEVDSAEIAKDAAEAERDRVQAELDAAKEEILRLEGEVGGMGYRPGGLELAEAEHEQLRTRMEEKYKELEKLEAEFWEEYGDRTGLWGPTMEQMERELRTGMISHTDTLRYKADKERLADARNVANVAGDRELAKAGEVEALKKLALKYQEVSRRLEEERKAAAGLEASAKAAGDGARRANDALRFTLQRTAMEGGQDDRMTDKRVKMQLAALGRDEAREEREGRRRELQRELDRVAREANRLATDKDKANDTQAFDMMADLLSTYGRDIRQYGVNVASLLDVCGKLDLQGKSARAQMATLEMRINRLQRQVDRTNSGQ